MTESNVSAAEGHNGDKEALSTNESTAGEPKVEHMNGSNGKSEAKERTVVQEPPAPPPVDDSTVSTPKARPSSRRTSEAESTMNYTPSPSSESGEKSADTSPQQALNQPVVSHVPASVQQPILQSSEQSSLASPAPQNLTAVVEGDSNANAAQQQQPLQILEGKPAGSVPTFQVIHGTGQVVTKQKGRFRLLQDSEPAAAGTNVAASDAAAGGIPGVAPVGGATPVAGLEGVVAGTHPSRERTLSNASTLSAMSVQNPNPAIPASGSSNTLTTDSSGNVHANGAPVGKKKGRFVVLPGDVTDPSLLRQPYPGQQGALRQQPLQPTTAVPVAATGTEQAIGNPPQSVVPVTQPPMPPQEVVQQQTQVGDSQHPQAPSGVPQQAQAIAGSAQHYPQQINAPQYFPPAPHAQIGGAAQQVVQMNVPQQQQQQVGPAVTHMQQRTSHSPVPPSNQPSQLPVYQQSTHPPAQILFSEAMPHPTYVVQTEDGRFHQVVAGPQHMVPIPEQQSVAQDTSLPQQQQYVHSQSGAPLPPATTSDASRAPQVVKAAAAIKRPTVQRSNSITKGTPTNVGFGKVLYFLEQMKQEVTEADRTIKNQGRDMKFLREKNKELEARSRDMERKWLEEKAAREALEAKVKSLKKKVKELKGRETSNVDNTVKELDDKHGEVPQRTKPESRSNSLDDVEKTVANASEALANGGAVPATVEKAAAASRSASSESKEKATVSVSIPSESIRRSSSGDVLSSQPVKAKAQSPPETAPCGQSEKLSPPRRRCSKDSLAEKMPTGKSPSTKTSFQSQNVATIDGPPVHIGVKAAVSSSGDSLGSSSEFDPLRSGHVGGHGDGTMSTTSDPVNQGHHQTLSTGSSVASFLTAPLPAQSIEFDPLSTSYQNVSVLAQENHVAQGFHCVPAEMQPPPQHSYSQSMPNFVVNQNSVAMQFPAQQMQQQGWNPNQQPVPNQAQYLPSQYAGPNMMGLNQQSQQYPVLQAPAVPQQQQYPNTKTSAADPFDELASRRAPPGAAGQ